MSAAPGAERFPDEMELLDGSELCLRELEIDQSLRELQSVTDNYVLHRLADDLNPQDHEKTQVELTAASQNVIWHLYDTGIFISREEDFDTTRHIVCELAMRLHDAFGSTNIRPDRHIETVPVAEAATTVPLHSTHAAMRVSEYGTRKISKPRFVELMAEHAAQQLEQDLLASHGIDVAALPRNIAERIDHDEFVQTMLDLRKLGRVSLVAVPLAYGANKLRALSKIAEQLATKAAA